MSWTASGKAVFDPLLVFSKMDKVRTGCWPNSLPSWKPESVNQPPSPLPLINGLGRLNMDVLTITMPLILEFHPIIPLSIASD